LSTMVVEQTHVSGSETTNSHNYCSIMSLIE
jgi:hypothetical protein